MKTYEHRSAHLPAVVALSAAGALTLAGLTVVPAHAHDSLIGSNPEAGEILDAPPSEVVLEFSGDGLTTGDAVTNDIWVLDEEEENWASAEPAEVEGSTMRTDLAEELPSGEYEVLYRVVYLDGHDEELSFEFEVDAEEPEGEVAAEEDSQNEPAEEDQEADADAPAAGDDDDDADLTADDADEGGQWWPILIGLGALAAVAAAAVLLRRRLRRDDRS